MAPSERDAASNGRKLTGSMLDNSGVAIERMPGLTSILELFCASLAGALQPLFGEKPGAAIEETRAAALFETIAESKGRAAALLRCEELDARLLIILDSNAADFVVDSVFGVDEETSSEPAPPRIQVRPRTGIETRLLGEFAQSLGRALEAGFAHSARAAFAFEGLQTLADVAILGRRDMPAVATRLRVTTKAGECGCLVLLPQTLLQALRQELAIEPASGAAAADPRWTRQMEVGVTKTRLPVTAIMEELEMTLGDVARFEVGHVLGLRGDGMGRVRLECAGRAMFWGRLGQGQGAYALEIEEAIEGDDAPSEERELSHG